MPLPIALLAGIPALFQTGVGIAQSIKASRINPERPNYEIPGQVREAESIMRGLAYSGLPGENIMREDLDRGFASTVAAAARAGGDIDSAVAAAGEQNRRGNLEMGARRAEFMQLARQRLAQQLGITAQYEDQAFELNKMQPYRDAIADKSALMQGGLENISGGLNSATQAIGYQALVNRMAPDVPGGGTPDAPGAMTPQQAKAAMLARQLSGAVVGNITGPLATAATDPFAATSTGDPMKDFAPTLEALDQVRKANEMVHLYGAFGTSREGLATERTPMF